MIEAQGGIVVFLPPYCWFLNPIEEAFGMVKQWVQRNDDYCRRHWAAQPGSSTRRSRVFRRRERVRVFGLVGIYENVSTILQRKKVEWRRSQPRNAAPHILGGDWRVGLMPASIFCLPPSAF
jgi:hypothetical protein